MIGVTTKMLTKDTVLEAVKKLTVKGNKITSLEVKEHLRKLGYWAVQTEVSTFLQELMSEDVLEAEQNPEWFNYSPQPFQDYWLKEEDGEDSSSQTTQQQTGTIDDVTEVMSGIPGVRTWKLFAYDNLSTVEIHVLRNVGRNVARAYYEKVYAVPYAKVGCSKVN